MGEKGDTNMSKSTSYKVGRSAVTGEFVSMDYAIKHPKTTVIESIKRKVG